jgi:hypothetical protein
VRLVEDQRVVAPQHRVALDLGEQDAIGHHADEAVVAAGLGQADLESDLGAEGHPKFFGEARGDRARGDAPRLRVADQAVDAAARLQAGLGQLGRLAGAVSPQTTMTGCAMIERQISSMRLLTGRSGG